MNLHLQLQIQWTYMAGVRITTDKSRAVVQVISFHRYIQVYQEQQQQQAAEMLQAILLQNQAEYMLGDITAVLNTVQVSFLQVQQQNLKFLLMIKLQQSLRVTAVDLQLPKTRKHMFGVKVQTVSLVLLIQTACQERITIQIM